MRGYLFPAVHPRRRGERWDRVAKDAKRDGSSPQARGTGKNNRVHRLRQRFIPAGAGNGPDSGDAGKTGPVHPRRRGERNPLNPNELPWIGSSPQARGTA